MKYREGCGAKVKPHDVGEELGSGDMNRVVKKMTKNRRHKNEDKNVPFPTNLSFKFKVISDVSTLSCPAYRRSYYPNQNCCCKRLPSYIPLASQGSEEK